MFGALHGHDQDVLHHRINNTHAYCQRDSPDIFEKWNYSTSVMSRYVWMSDDNSLCIYHHGIQRGIYKSHLRYFEMKAGKC
jgi:hypothetical protein